MSMKSRKLDKAVARARDTSDGGEGQTEEEAASEAIAMLADVSGEIQQFDAKALVAKLKEEGYRAGERFIEVPEGGMISGYLMARGVASVQDPNTGKDRDVARWHFELDSGARVSHLGSAQLDRQLGEHPADGSTHFVIARGAIVETKKGRRMGEWYVIGKRKREPVRQLVEPVATPAPAPEVAAEVAK